MKKFLGVLFLSLFIFTAMSWSDRKAIESIIDEKIAQYIMEKQNGITNHDVYEDLNSGKYQQDGKFLLKKYAEDLGYYVVNFPKYNDETILILRYGPRKVIIKQDEKIEIKIDGDKWDDGLDIKLKSDTGKYVIDCGKESLIPKIDNDKVLQIASMLVNLRTSDTLEEMATKNRNDFEKFLTTPNILKDFS